MSTIEPKGDGARTGGGTAGTPIREDLLEILRCPLGKAPLRIEGNTLVCTKCGLTYKIEDGIPNMLVDEAILPAGVSDLKDLACSRGAGGGA